ARAPRRRHRGDAAQPGGDPRLRAFRGRDDGAGREDRQAVRPRARLRDRDGGGRGRPPPEGGAARRAARDRSPPRRRAGRALRLPAPDRSLPGLRRSRAGGGGRPPGLEAAILRLAELPRVPLATLPTPLAEAPRLAAALGGPRLWLKRDDLTGFALGGNKVR